MAVPEERPRPTGQRAWLDQTPALRDGAAMSAVTAFLFKQRMRWYARGIDRAHDLRRRLAYYVARHGFEVGDYSLGNPTVRLYNESRLIVGKYSSIAAGATFILGGNHR